MLSEVGGLHGESRTYNLNGRNLGGEITLGIRACQVVLGKCVILAQFQREQAIVVFHFGVTFGKRRCSEKGGEAADSSHFSILLRPKGGDVRVLYR